MGYGAARLTNITVRAGVPVLPPGARRSTSGTVCAVVSIDISSARLVPGAGDDGWLCRLPSALVWAPGRGPAAAELVSVCMAAASPPELIGRLGAHLADPEAAPWPPFAIVVARGADLVAVVHGPVELMVGHAGTEERLYGGDEVGSWLNRALHNVSVLRAGATVTVDSLSDLRQGVVRAAGFVLMPAGVGGGGPSEVPGEGEAAEEVAPAPAARPAAARPAPAPSAEAPVLASPAESSFPVRRFADDDFSQVVPGGDFSAESPTVVEQAVDVSAPMGGEGAFLGRLTWDNGEVDELHGPALVGRDVAADESVLSGRLSPVVPSGQNDSMSRVHAELGAHDGQMVVTDRGSTNGTFIWDEGVKAWQRLAAGQPQVVVPGTVLAFGERTATFEGPGPLRVDA